MNAYLMENGGPILRWRTAVDLLAEDASLDRQKLFKELLARPEVQRWLELLGSGPVHHSKDSSAENALAKLCEYGLKAGIPQLDERALPYCDVLEGGRYHQEAIIIVPFLIRAGYWDEPRINQWITTRINTLYEIACRRDYDFYMDEEECQALPVSQRSKLFYSAKFSDHWSYLALPTCYDLYALAYLPKTDPIIRQKVETIVSYLLAPAFQETPGGYIWNRPLHRPYAAGRVLLSCLPRDTEREKMVLFMEMLVNFDCGQLSEWFRSSLEQLKRFRTERGSYCFPSRYLSEKSSYYLYSGKHMGLGEAPRNQSALELESTFRMLRLIKLMSIYPTDASKG